MLKIYGSMLCPDCVDCCADLDKAKVEYEFLDFSADLRNLKAFLMLRDEKTVFDAVKREGAIGIPCILREDGSITLTWEEYM